MAIEGAAPVVNIISPAGGGTLDGIQTISWQIDDADSTDVISWVQYSADNGVSWRTLATRLNSTELKLEFDELPGSDGNALIKVLVSDGANTGIDTSETLTVPKKAPTAAIIFPQDGSIFRLGDSIWFKGQGLDLEDNPLLAASMVWKSNKDGTLGAGDQLPTATLSEGEHTITFTVEDQDGNLASDTVMVFVDGTRPALELTITPDGRPASCVGVNIDASIPSGSSGLQTGEYSFDGGITWTSIDLTTLPLSLTVPGKGFVHLVARVIDNAGNLAAADAKFFIDTPCPNTVPVANAGIDYSGTEGQTISLDGSQSIDPDGIIILYAWDIDNDGEFDDATGTKPIVSFTDNGVYTVSLQVTDDHNATAIDIVNVNTVNISPTIKAGPDISLFPGDFASLDEVMITDPGAADSHTASVNWGDGVVEEAQVFGDALYAEHSYIAAGSYIVEVCVIDDDLGVGCDTFTVRVETPEYTVFLPVAAH